MKKTKTHLRLYFGVLAALFFFVLAPGRAEAAGYKTVWFCKANGYADAYGKAKVGKYYFSMKDDFSDGKVYVSKSSSKKNRTLIADIAKPMFLGQDYCDYEFLTNGERMIYESYSDGLTKLCGVDLNGKNRKTYDSVKDGFILVHEVSGGQIYYTKWSGQKGSLCSMSLKTGKKKTLVKGCMMGDMFSDETSGSWPTGSCYLDDQGTKAVVTLYDWQKHKVARTYTVQKSAKEEVHLIQSGKYVYFVVAKKGASDSNSNRAYKIYRCQESKGGRAVLYVKSLKAGTDRSIGISGKKVYYYKNGKKGRTYYCYHVDTKKTEKISASSGERKVGVRYKTLLDLYWYH